MIKLLRVLSMLAAFGMVFATVQPADAHHGRHHHHHHHWMHRHHHGMMRMHHCHMMNHNGHFHRVCTH